MLILIAGEKGGSGKSTIAVQLGIERARRRFRVLVVDGDPQGTAKNWLERRVKSGLKPDVPCLSLRAADLHDEIAKRVDDYDDILIDIAGRDSEEMRIALGFVDVVLFPVRPTMNDLEISEKMDALVGRFLEQKSYLKNALFVLSQASPNPFRQSTNRDAQAFLSECGNIGVAQAIISLRAAYEKAAIEGASISEIAQKDHKAIQEFTQLYNEIFND